MTTYTHEETGTTWNMSSSAERIKATYATPLDAIKHQGRVMAQLMSELRTMMVDLTMMLGDRERQDWADAAEYAAAAEYANAMLAALRDE